MTLKVTLTAIFALLALTMAVMFFAAGGQTGIQAPTQIDQFR